MHPHKIIKYLLVLCISTLVSIQGISQELSKDKQYEQLLSQGMKEAAQKNFASSNIALKQCVTLMPEQASAYFELAKNYDNLGDGKQAVYFSKRASSLSPSNLWYEEYLLSTAVKYKDLNTITDVLYKRFIRDNSSIEPLLGIYTSSESWDKALSLIEEYENKNGRSESSISYLTDVYLKSKDYKKALPLSKELCKLSPNDSQYILQRAFIMSQLGKEEDVWKMIEDFYRGHPHSGEIAYSLLPRYQQTQNYKGIFDATQVIVADTTIDKQRRGQTLYTVGVILAEKPEFITQFEAALDTLLSNTQDFAILDAFASEYFYQKKDSLRGFEHLRKAVRGGFDDEGSNISLLYKEADNNEHKMIMEDAPIVLKKYPKSPQAWYIYSFAAHESGDLNLAISTLEEAKKLSESLSISFYTLICSTLGSYYDQAKQYEKAEENFNASLSLSPNDPTTLNNYAYSIATRGGDLFKARSLAEKALQLDPDKPYILDTYAWILYLSKDLKNAMIHIQKAFEIDPNQSIEVHEHYYKILLANSMTDKAKEVLTQIQKLKTDKDE